MKALYKALKEDLNELIQSNYETINIVRHEQLKNMIIDVDDQCSICYHDYKSNDKVYVFSCMHHNHTKCTKLMIISGVRFRLIYMINQFNI